MSDLGKAAPAHIKSGKWFNPREYAGPQSTHPAHLIFLQGEPTLLSALDHCHFPGPRKDLKTHKL